VFVTSYGDFNDFAPRFEERVSTLRSKDHASGAEKMALANERVATTAEWQLYAPGSVRVLRHQIEALFEQLIQSAKLRYTDRLYETWGEAEKSISSLIESAPECEDFPDISQRPSTLSPRPYSPRGTTMTSSEAK
jgi:hypothetical protein